MPFTLGTDPEFFILDGQDKPVPAWKFFPDKTQKVKLIKENDFLRDRYNAEYHKPDEILAFRDGYAVEINVPAVWCRGNLVMYMLKGIENVKAMLPPDHKLSSTPAVKIKVPDDLFGAPDDCRIFGCDPSWNAYTMEYGALSLDAASHPYRYAGGHMHISAPTIYRKDHSQSAHFMQWIFDKNNIPLFIKMMDLYVGLPLTIWFAKDETFLRRQCYGQAGEFRFQSYGKGEDGEPAAIGCEYRVPGPEVWNSPMVASFAFGTMRKLADDFDKLRYEWDKGLEPDIRHAINTGEGAEKLLRSLPGWLTGAVDEAQFKKTISVDRPFQVLVDKFTANSDVSHRGWDNYHFMKARGEEYSTISTGGYRG